MRTPIPNHLKRHLSGLRYSTAEHVLHEIEVGDGYFVRVVGDADNGCYEWCIERPHQTPFTKRSAIEFSDVGYGESAVALRDGLIAYYGLPTRLVNKHPELVES
jgi:hypothetical protein